MSCDHRVYILIIAIILAIGSLFTKKETRMLRDEDKEDCYKFIRLAYGIHYDYDKCLEVWLEDYPEYSFKFCDIKDDYYVWVKSS